MPSVPPDLGIGPPGGSERPKLVIDRSTTTDRVAAALRRALFDGVLTPGTPLREAELASRFGVARGTLREALRLLEADGLVVREPNRGVVVKVLSAVDLADLYQARRIIEQGAAAARRADGLPALRAALASYEAALNSGDEQQITETHLQLHVAVVALAANRTLTRLAASLLAELRLALAAADRRRHDTGEQLAAHRQLVERLAGTDTAAALAAVDDHLAGALAEVASPGGAEPAR